MTVTALDSARRDKIGGSDAAAACGVHPHYSRVAFVIDRIEGNAPEESEAMRWGTLIEPLIFDQLDASGYEPMPAPTDGFVAKGKPWMIAHPGGFVPLDGERAVLEIKTAGQWSGRDWHSEAGAPLQYLVQCHHNMYVTGCGFALLACLIGGQKLETRVVVRQEAIIDKMLRLEKATLRYIKRGEIPPPDGSKSAGDAISDLYPETDKPTMRVSQTGYEHVKAMRLLAEESKERDRQYDAHKQAVQLEMKDAWAALSPYDDLVCEWGMVESHRFDTKRFRKDHPEFDLDYYMPTRTRRFTLK